MQKHLARFGKLNANDVIGLMSKVEVSIEPDESFGIQVYSPKRTSKAVYSRSAPLYGGDAEL